MTRPNNLDRCRIKSLPHNLVSNVVRLCLTVLYCWKTYIRFSDVDGNAQFSLKHSDPYLALNNTERPQYIVKFTGFSKFSQTSSKE